MLDFRFSAPSIVLLDRASDDVADDDAEAALLLVAESERHAFFDSPAGHPFALAEQIAASPLSCRRDGQYQWLCFIDPEALLGALLSARIPMPGYQREAKGPAPLHRVTLSPAYPLPLDRLLAEVEGNGLARYLAAMPSSELGAASYRQRVRALAEQEGWQWQELDEVELARRGAGAFLAVASGAEAGQAAMVRLRYQPTGARRKLALVGKGICHDSGGYSLKVGGGMYGMHLDMGGSAVALGTLLAISRAGLPVEVECWLAIAENHIGPRAYRPGDLVRAYDGTTIEVVDTDAEGRMVLADALSMAAEGAPDLLIDYATLTGACKRALGSRYSGAFTNRPAWFSELIEAGQQAGERIWPFPLDEDYDESLKSEWADLLQCAPGASCDHIDAARFLQHFVPASIPWLHLDLSGFRHKGGHGLVASEITGFGVRLTLTLLARQPLLSC
ncbi:M17 family metallopeptidase [Aeromonas simiae]|uniref:M17 family metallopeptidase n=1 Tax=Aeromonas simiae TaxID=218936 RepID=UPI00266B3BDD|nr:leucyl aminopeptidase family protein [Aeromonas simiae]MDO2947691.1 leucyl aminopeptidase family protein [Aeromonas simiae]MDO2952311.1 leucyl aminopeptidase family protein [Aeromonas simiae]MDO2954906.1 leucyl aminopeptidase family protein [Aeromonas simiae]